MKSYKKIESKYAPKEIAESYVFPNELDLLQRTQSKDIFQKWRNKNESNRSVKSKLITKLLQLKYIMEDYIRQSEYKEGIDFSYFLVQYIGRLEIRKKVFAQEMDVDPTELSQILNRHRPPSEKFIIKLELHSNKNFPAIIWFKIIEKERCFRLQNDTEMRIAESKYVKPKLDFSI